MKQLTDLKGTFYMLLPLYQLCITNAEVLGDVVGKGNRVLEGPSTGVKLKFGLEEYDYYNTDNYPELLTEQNPWSITYRRSDLTNIPSTVKPNRFFKDNIALGYTYESKTEDLCTIDTTELPDKIREKIYSKMTISCTISVRWHYDEGNVNQVLVNEFRVDNHKLDEDVTINWLSTNIKLRGYERWLTYPWGTTAKYYNPTYGALEVFVSNITLRYGNVASNTLPDFSDWGAVTYVHWNIPKYECSAYCDMNKYWTQTSSIGTTGYPGILATVKALGKYEVTYGDGQTGIVLAGTESVKNYYIGDNKITSLAVFVGPDGYKYSGSYYSAGSYSTLHVSTTAAFELLDDITAVAFENVTDHTVPASTIEKEVSYK